MAEISKIKKTTRRCRVCKEELPNTNEYFHRRKHGEEALGYTCKVCKDICEILRKKHQTPEQREARVAREKAYQRTWRKKNRDKTSGYEKKWITNHRAQYLEIVRNGKKNEYDRKKDTDPQYIIGKRLRTRIYLLLKGKRKSASTMELLGCSLDFFLKYIESLFQEGMSFDNYGKDGWVLDHDRPCASFDLTNPEEQKKCFHYSNIKPLWAIDNMKKSSFYDGIFYSQNK
jgi:hypothetical protein